jgi:hypothetical protein
MSELHKKMLDKGFANPYSKRNLKGGVLRLPGKGRDAEEKRRSVDDNLRFLFDLEQSEYTLEWGRTTRR